MKNFICIVEPQEIFDYLGQLWRSDLFKKSHSENVGYINTISQKFSKTPRIFFDMHEETMEMVHFSSWFHAIQHRYHYTNDILHDLYYHHEFYHLITMQHDDKIDFNRWTKKMRSNEFWASLESEVLIYFYMPELRQQSFKMPLWVDRFLDDPYYKDLYGKYFKHEDDLSRKLKSRIAYFRDECQFNPVTDLDRQIADYTTSSLEWERIWKENGAWHEVESEMCKYLAEVESNPKQAMQNHLQWLNQLQSLDPYHIAYGHQAREYSAVHRRLFQSSYIPKN